MCNFKVDMESFSEDLADVSKSSFSGKLSVLPTDSVEAMKTNICLIEVCLVSPSKIWQQTAVPPGANVTRQRRHGYSKRDVGTVAEA